MRETERPSPALYERLVCSNEPERPNSHEPRIQQRAKCVRRPRRTRSCASVVLHTHAPVAIQTGTPQLTAADYLHQFGELLGLTLAELANLSLTPSTSETPCRLARLPSMAKAKFSSSAAW